MKSLTVRYKNECPSYEDGIIDTFIKVSISDIDDGTDIDIIYIEQGNSPYFMDYIGELQLDRNTCDYIDDLIRVLESDVTFFIFPDDIPSFEYEIVEVVE